MLVAARLQENSLVLLPEMFSTGFSMNVSRTSDSETRDDQNFLADIARQHRVFIIGGITTSAPSDKGMNQATAFDPTGREIARYSKLQPFSGGKETEHFVA